MFQSTKTIKTIFYLNVVMFIATLILPSINVYLAMYDLNDSKLFMPWQLITHQFLHAGIIHILFNMLVLLSFGPSVEDIYGSKNTWIYYLSCGIGGSLLHSFMVNSGDIPLVGASGAVWGIIVLFTLLNPNQKMYLFLIPIGIKAKYLITVLFAYEVFSGFTGSGGNVANFGHVGGAIVGAIIFLLHKFKIIGKKYSY